MRRILFFLVILLSCFLAACNITENITQKHSKRAEEYAVFIEDYEEGSAKYHAFCKGFDAGWDQHSEEHNEDDARDQGYEDGYDEGRSDGYSEGYDDGYEFGYEAGIDYIILDDTDYSEEIRADVYNELRQSFDDEYTTGLCDGYYDGYSDAKDGLLREHELFDYSWIESLSDNIGYRSGYEIGYEIGYRDYISGALYDTSFDY